MRFPALWKQLSGGSGYTAVHDGGSKGRNQRTAITALSSVLAKGLAGVVTLVSIPMTLKYLGQERFGLWMAIASLQTILAFADFGLGYSLLNLVAEALGRKDPDRAERAIRTGVVAQSAIASLILLAFFGTLFFVDWPGILRVHDAAATEVVPTLVVFVSTFCLRSIVSVIQQAQFGLQQGYVANFWTAIGNICSLGGVLLATKLEVSLPVLCALVTAPPVIAGVINAAWWLPHRFPGTRFKFSLNQSQQMLLRGMLAVGAQFFFLQLLAVLNLGIDPLIVARVLGPTAVASLTIVQKPFELFNILFLLLLQPFWPAYREAIASGELDWVRKTFWRVLLFTTGSSLVIATFMICFGTNVLSLWLGPSAHPDRELVIAYSVVVVLLASQNPISFLFNGLGKVGFQIKVGVPVVVLSVTLKVILLHTLGVVAVPLVTAATCLVLIVPAQGLYLRHLLRTFGK